MSQENKGDYHVNNTLLEKSDALECREKGIQENVSERLS